MSDQPPCPNPKGMTVEFAENVIETRAWRLKGVGAYGSDVDVVSVDCYRDLVAELSRLQWTLGRWAKSAIAYEKALKEIAADEVIPERMTLSEWAQLALDEQAKALRIDAPDKEEYR